MNDQIKQIAERLRGLRDVLELTSEDIARDCDISAEEYRLAETGQYDISVSMLQKIARTYNIALDTLMFGEEPKMSSYFVTRAGKGVSIQRTRAYKYQSLASGFMNRTADPFIVTVEPKGDDEPIHYNHHNGQEFNLVVEGRMLINIEGKEIILNQGDSIYFNSKLPHGMKALDGKTVFALLTSYRANRLLQRLSMSIINRPVFDCQGRLSSWAVLYVWQSQRLKQWILVACPSPSWVNPPKSASAPPHRSANTRNPWKMIQFWPLKARCCNNQMS